LVWLAGQNELQVCAGVTPTLRVIGKKRPSHRRTQNAPVPAISAPGASGARGANGLNWNGSA
jgi:hypothetical protein